jgi:uncharacterized protein (DUF427 family)
MTRPVLTPTEQHPITITPTDGRVVVRVGDTVLADSSRAVTLQEADYPPVQYVPVADVDQGVLRPSATETYCPYKGDCSYYSIVTGDGEVTDAVWFYPEPSPAVGEIKDHVAFYADRVDLQVTA